MDGLQNYSVFISARRIYWIIKNDVDGKIEQQKSTGISEESIKNLHTSDISSAPKLKFNFKKQNLKESA